MEGRTFRHASLSEGDVLAERYCICSVLGEGGCGVVYVAEALGDHAAGAGHRVALKVIHRHLVHDYQISQRFHREARILARLRSPHIAALLDFGESDEGQLYMAQQLVDGSSLEELIAPGPVRIDRALDLSRQVCAALDAAHAAGVVHRDLKPSNVMVEPLDDGTERARVLDFGMAKLVRGDGTDSLGALTEQNMVFGTPEYMAPEQARGEPADERTDVYAVGVMLYELITGTVPFSSNTPIGMMTAHLTAEPEPPSSRAPARRIPPALEAVVLHALAKSPGDRYPSAAALRAALDQAESHPTDVLSTRPPPTDADDELGMRATELALSDTQAMRRTEPALARNSEVEQALPRRVEAHPTAEPASRAWIVVAVVAALLGVLMGIIMSLTGGS